MRHKLAASKGGRIDFSIDDVLAMAMKKPDMIHIELDIGGGVVTFAVRMLAMNIMIVTTSMNLNGPFNNFITTRGVVLPFFDNKLDIVAAGQI
jgi:hypothetical protein